MQDTVHEVPIAIIGCGASGTLLAWNLARRHGIRATVIDAARQPALGLAYATPCMSHLLNVRSSGMSAIDGEPDHFIDWLRRNIDPHSSPDDFAPRAIFGRYLSSLHNEAAPLHHHAEVLSCRADNGDYRLALSDGATLRARQVVLATGNFDPPPLPAVDPAAGRDGIYHHNAWDHAFYETVDPQAAIVLIGTGLTTVDVITRLRDAGHRGPLTALSRRGWFPTRHADTPLPKHDRPAVGSDALPTARAYLAAFRKTLKHGVALLPAIDSLRATSNDLWLRLPPTEQKRFRRHLQRRWDILRHRMAPSVADQIDAMRAAGRLRIVNGHVNRIAVHDGQACIVYRAGDRETTLLADHVVNCTGPDQNYRRVASPLFRDLMDCHLIAPGPLGNGLSCDAEGRLCDGMFAVGPARLGTLFESIAIPEIRAQTAALADRLARA
ncbi:hydroxyacylglutathione hydrolase [Neoasaia chiangmaiensis NBRC 101099]|uniref:FAD/NAD(P)-binding protein n=1 Tax=Neoasaia chiangmaiensis TaxID=320497 RepID=UPI0011958391|nr:FAD/NAD(P)-binding protein [Neoasaia chiangmaiensis]GBR39325.1 hydroxyacylglutathione hydrolase [Neoasaia chiangmaiensis NBRC 101099]GEN14525.1 hydroxyacylglutathione hydrolase [Neoasaia chiangmaiensis]